MNYDALEKNVMDVIKEQQIKLGFLEESTRLYYPLDSLNGLLGEQLDEIEMKQALKGFASYVESRLGKVKVGAKGERFGLMIPPEGSSYVHEHGDTSGFLEEFIDTISRHSCNLEHLVKVFKRYSDQVVVQAQDHEEFDYVIYFEDGKPDDNRYMIKFEGEHAIYHRFTRFDYENFDF